MFRQSLPGAMKMPQGAKDRERFEALEGRVVYLESQLELMASTLSDLHALVLDQMDEQDGAKKPKRGRPRKEQA